jgi:glycosyltransferase involved in cell wall biosynthesis
MMEPTEKTIVVLADMPPPVQGISLVTEWVVKNLQTKDYSVKVLDTAVKRSRHYYFLRVSAFLRAGRQVLSIQSGDILYVPLSHGFTLYFQTLIILLARRRNFRVLAHHHTYLPINRPKNIRHLICHGLLALSAEHIFLSEKMKVEYADIWQPRNRLWVITNNGVAVTRMVHSGTPPVSDRRIGLIFAGKVSREKGFFHILDISRELLSLHKSTTLTILGPSGDKTILHELTRLSIDFPEQFTYFGAYTEIELLKELGSSMLFLFPSEYKNEASPLVVLEAQALGNICITTEIGSLPSEVLKPGVSVRIEEWANSVRELHASAVFSPLAMPMKSSIISKETYILSKVAETALVNTFKG